MKTLSEFRIFVVIGITSVLLSISCSEKKTAEFKMDNLYAWCIVPFDLLNRSPTERINMLSNIGFSEYAYDWREENISEMASEWKLAQESNINIRAVWIWLDARRDTIGQLHWTNEALLRTLKQENLKTEIWLGFHLNYFEGDNDEENIKKGIDIISYLHGRADSIGCNISLYNHGDWFGNPKNQIKIIKEIPDADIGIIYNFHHAYDQVQLLPTMINEMLPHVRSVNVSGVVKGNANITDFGEGDHELDMLRSFIDAGYQGPIGLLGHRENVDVEKVLAKNIKHFIEAKKQL